MNLELKDMVEDRNEIAAEIRRMSDLNHDPNHEWTAQDEESWQKVNADFSALSARIERAERAEAVEQVVAEADGPPPGREAGGSPAPERRGESTYQPRRRQPSEMDKALALQAWCLAQSGRPLRDEHRNAARAAGVDLTAKDLEIRVMSSAEQRRLRREMRQMSTALTEGGDTIPEGFVRNWEQALLFVGGVRPAAAVMRTASGNDLPWPTTDDTSNSGALLAENTQDSAQAVATSVMTLGAYKYTSKICLVSAELMEDSAFDLATELGRMMGERIARATEAHFTTGTGTDQPNGIVTASTAGKTAASATAITTDEILDLIHSVDVSYRAGAAFMMHDNVVLALRKLRYTGGSEEYIWQPGAQLGVPDRLFGYPVFVNNKMASSLAASAKAVLFGQLSKYIIRDVRSIRLRRLVERYADYDQEGFVAFSRHDGDLLDAGTHPVKHLVMAAA